jgi:seryl-tRNA synthetase
MLDVKYIRENVDEVRENIKQRKANVDLDAFLKVDEARLRTLQQIEETRQKRNDVAKRVKGGGEDRQALIEEGKALKERLSVLEADFEELKIEWEGMLHRIPNRSHPDVPVGETDADNVEIKQVGEKPDFSFTAKDHMELATKLGLVDFERGAKVTGSKFYFLKNQLAILEQAMIRYAIDFAMAEGFEFMKTPDLAKEEVLVAKGFMPRGPETQVYFIEGNDLALIGTSEITILGYHGGEVLPAESLPKKYVAFSHCYRTEAGTYGKESHGLYRVHQFAKVEMFAFTAPDQSDGMHAEMLRTQEAFWQSLGVPYRVVDCVTGDLGGPDYRRYDIEAWMPGRGENGGWGEVTSTSNCVDYQSRGMDIKYQSKDDERGLVHTLNGTVVATPRALIPLLENFQREDGTIAIPDVLKKYTGFDEIGA